MVKQILFCFLLLSGSLTAQEPPAARRWHLGAAYGFGHEFRQRNYMYDNSYIQVQVYYTFNPGRRWQYQLAVQPEVNFARHRLLNLYFVKPSEPDYQHRREVFTREKDIREYILNVSFFIRRAFTRDFSMYVMGNVGPMITDTETERLSKGFAFCDVFAVGASYNFGGVILDVRPNLRHVSNGGLQQSNAGFNTYNFNFGMVFRL